MSDWSHMRRIADELESEWITLRDTLLDEGVKPSQLWDMAFSVESAVNQMYGTAAYNEKEQV